MGGYYSNSHRTGGALCKCVEYKKNKINHLTVLIMKLMHNKPINPIPAYNALLRYLVTKFLRFYVHYRFILTREKR